MAANYLPLKKMEELEENISLLESNIKELISNGFPKVDQDKYVELLLKFSSHDLSDKEAVNIFIRPNMNKRTVTKNRTLSISL